MQRPADHPPFSIALAALRSLAAVVIAIGLARMMGLHNPFWAGLPVWVVAQPFREDLLARAFLRIVGTLIGAALGLGLLWLAPPGPVLVLCMAVLMGGFAGLGYWIGSVYSYGPAVAGLTLAVVLLPSLIEGPGAMENGVDRIIATIIGVIAVTVISFAFTPRRNDARPPRQRQGRIARSAERATLTTIYAGLGGALLLAYPSYNVLGGALGLTILCSLASATDTPRPMLTGIFPGIIIGSTAALLYRGLTLDLPTTSALLFGVTVLFLAAGSYFRAHPRTMWLGIDANMSFLLIGEIGMQGHAYSTTVFSAVSMVIAAGLVALVLRHRYLRD